MSFPDYFRRDSGLFPISLSPEHLPCIDLSQGAPGFFCFAQEANAFTLM
jgi:hypothetical protein